jgi:lipopolysaccharide transport system ATP-binding protein
MTVISVENVSKAYRLGMIGGGTLREDITRWWARVRGAPDPLMKIGEEHYPRRIGEHFWALRDVSFQVGEGEVLGVIGRNGAGKSTLLKILSQVTAPTSGEIKVKGRIASLLEVGTGFHPELSGRENIFLNGAILGMTKAEIRRKFDEIIAFSEIEEFLDTPVKRYSSGMYVRLAFAVAAHLEPEILVVDEVLAVGDAAFQKKCLGKMGAVAKTGRTVIFVSHNMPAIASLTNTALYLAGGELQAYGPTSEVIGCYTTAGQGESLAYADEETGSTPKVTSVRLETSLEGNVHIQNEPLRIEIQIHAPTAIVGACVSVQVFDANQINYVHVWCHDEHLPFCRRPGLHVLRCFVPHLRLYLGRYRLRIFFSEPPGGRQFQTLEGICPFEVIMPNTRRLFQWWPNECSYLEDCSWEVGLVHE